MTRRLRGRISGASTARRARIRCSRCVSGPRAPPPPHRIRPSRQAEVVAAVPAASQARRQSRATAHRARILTRPGWGLTSCQASASVEACAALACKARHKVEPYSVQPCGSCESVFGASGAVGFSADGFCSVAFCSAAFISSSCNGCSSIISRSDMRPVSHARFIG